MLETIILGGSMMIPLMIESVLTLAVLLDRVCAFFTNSRIDVRALRAEVLTLLGQGRLEDAMVLCQNTPGPVSAVLLVGLQTYAKLKATNASPETIRMVVGKGMEDFSVHAMSAVEKRLNILSTVGNSAPLFGMTGTVTGMITSFNALASAGALDAGLVAAGISEALITTAAGLLIAMAAVIPFNIFTSLSDTIALEIEEASTELVDALTTAKT
ncbi:MAG: MotA/TolQ/ExbB proton channel family protein [Planctomycetes bacterium]|nr:MotA/TolQ/ExbB proton channel family protein [Planctomycetota bacterium]